ncbi:MAG TPA: type II toxin-antitoxin system HicB family antitoxin [Dehalococcoidia bacterium]|jgi:predicted RNase H-like HicB family nuclease|nr:type II toxin-antitoxin system HicB family antitoxin [Dehalococcoidia bacterium]
MKSYVFKVELEEEDGIWSAVVPALPGCAVDGGSKEEALDAIREAAQAYVDILIEDGRPVPTDDRATTVIEGPAVAIVT